MPARTNAHFSFASLPTAQAFRGFAAFSAHMWQDVCTRVCVHTRAAMCVCVCVSNTDETDSDLIQLKTNTLFCLQTLSWKQAGFPGYQRKGQTPATDRDVSTDNTAHQKKKERKTQNRTRNKRSNTMAGSVLTFPS